MATSPSDLSAGFSSQKREILLLLKRAPDRSLTDIAADLHVSKVAALKHLTSLEREQLVERSYRTSGIGRPRAHFRLSGSSARLFPEAYTQMSLSALAFIEQRLGHAAVVELLQQRAREVADATRARFEGRDLPGKVAELARVRAEGGYMAEMGGRRKGAIEMREHNCPILALAGQYPEACEVERRLFENLLKANVDVSHRVVAGDPVCRFLIRATKVPR